jgi:hypothetical protein
MAETLLNSLDGLLMVRAADMITRIAGKQTMHMDVRYSPELSPGFDVF